jgi:antitoxin PrlF
MKLAKKAAGDAKTAAEACACCRVDSLVSVDERGQMVLPKELRLKAGIQAGDKLAVVCYEKDGEVCCLTLMKVDLLNSIVKDVLSPLMQEVL